MWREPVREIVAFLHARRPTDNLTRRCAQRQRHQADSFAVDPLSRLQGDRFDVWVRR
jgi:hypothetical protein